MLKLHKNFCFFKNKYLITYFVFLITPLIDTINGIYIIKNGPTGISIGTFYRLLLLIYVMLKSIRYKKIIMRYIPLIILPSIAIIRGYQAGNLFGCITYAAKWLLPIFLIIYFTMAFSDIKEIHNCLIRIFNVWTWYIPLSLIIEYVFDIGKTTYHDAGFKGLYYSTNDIAVILTLMFAYILYRLFVKISVSLIIRAILILISIIILSTKSCGFFVGLCCIYYIFGVKKFNKKNTVLLILIASIGGILVFIKMNNEISSMLNRYINMWEISMRVSDNSIINQFFIFATSGRTTRIEEFFSVINDSGNYIINILFGWIIPDNAHVIEMDFHDLICQYGIVGFMVVIAEYVTLFKGCKKRVEPFFVMTIIGFIYAFLAGHAISGALSGTALAIVVSIFIIESKYISNQNEF